MYYDEVENLKQAKVNSLKLMRIICRSDPCWDEVVEFLSEVDKMLLRAECMVPLREKWARAAPK